MKRVFPKKYFARLAGAMLALFLCIPINANAQKFSPSELDTLVSTIALYPDPLLAHVLTASIQGEEIQSASLWATAHKYQKGEELTAEMEHAGLSYSPSVLALIPFPTILATMAKYNTWTSQLGTAVYYQNSDVMDAIQRMRHAAYNHGNLKTDQRNKVSNGPTITIEPIEVHHIYVPVYNPSIVYFVHNDGYVPLYYGTGVWLGGWYSDWNWNNTWFEWHSHMMYHHPYPPRYHRPPPPRRFDPYYDGRPTHHPRNDHRLPLRSSSQNYQSKETRRFDQNAPIYRDNSSRGFKLHDGDRERSLQNTGNVTASHSRDNTSYSEDRRFEERKSEDSRNDDRRYDERRNNGNFLEQSGFRRSTRH